MPRRGPWIGPLGGRHGSFGVVHGNMDLVMVLLVGLGVDLAVRLVEECVIAFVLLVGAS